MEGKGEVKQEIEAAAMQDAGEYHCVASNEDDSTPDKKSITLSVKGMEIISSHIYFRLWVLKHSGTLHAFYTRYMF